MEGYLCFCMENHVACNMELKSPCKLASLFKVSNYSKELEEMKHVTKQEFIASLRR